MADQKTFERVCDIIRETAGLENIEMTPTSTLEEIGLDSLGTVEVLVAVEDEFGIELDTDDNPKTVGAFADAVEAEMERERCLGPLSATCWGSRPPSYRAVWRGLPMPRLPLLYRRRAAWASSPL